MIEENKITTKYRSQKPVAILKAGRTLEGQRSTASHTGSLATSQAVFSGVCRQHGAIVAEDIETLYDYAKALATMQPPSGNRVLCEPRCYERAELSIPETRAQVTGHKETRRLPSSQYLKIERQYSS